MNFYSCTSQKSSKNLGLQNENSKKVATLTTADNTTHLLQVTLLILEKQITDY